VPTKETLTLVGSLGFRIPQDEISELIGTDPKSLRLYYSQARGLTGASWKKELARAT